MFDLIDQLIQINIMQIEGRPIQIGVFADILDGDLRRCLVLLQFKKRVFYEFLC